MAIVIKQFNIGQKNVGLRKPAITDCNDNRKKIF